MRKYITEKAPYFWATLLFVGWLLFSEILLRNHDSAVEKLVSYLLGVLRIGGAYHISLGSFLLLSPLNELKMFFGPGFFAGVIIGYYKIRSLPGCPKALFPAVIVLVPAIPALFVREGFLIVSTSIYAFLVYGGIYSIIGGLCGWLLNIASAKLKGTCGG